MRSRGMTLVEVMVGTAVLVTGGGALLLGMHYALVQSDYLNHTQIALQAAQGELERLTGEAFGTLATGAAYNGARQSGQLAAINNAELPGAALGIQIKTFPAGTPWTTATLLDLHVAACWTSRGRRIGEDQNCNGVLDVGEDANGNGWIDSPAMVSTRVATDG
ncbi:MAG: hypothetical protein HYT90_05400 [Candidatus Omnitrophica bacterium]|nr:hypothetical protein [Candidatus Omnitrophota bacterium]